MSDNRVSKQVKVKDKVKRDRYIIVINYKLSWGNNFHAFSRCPGSPAKLKAPMLARTLVRIPDFPFWLFVACSVILCYPRRQFNSLQHCHGGTN